MNILKATHGTTTLCLHFFLLINKKHTLIALNKTPMNDLETRIHKMALIWPV